MWLLKYVLIKMERIALSAAFLSDRQFDHENCKYGLMNMVKDCLISYNLLFSYSLFVRQKNTMHTCCKHLLMDVV